jgi:ankyrin repeat protein
MNVPNVAGNTPLHVAVLNGHHGCVSLLLQYGADPAMRYELRSGSARVYRRSVDDDD